MKASSAGHRTGTRAKTSIGGSGDEAPSPGVPAGTGAGPKAVHRRPDRAHSNANWNRGAAAAALKSKGLRYGIGQGNGGVFQAHPAAFRVVRGQFEGGAQHAAQPADAAREWRRCAAGCGAPVRSGCRRSAHAGVRRGARRPRRTARSHRHRRASRPGGPPAGRSRARWRRPRGFRGTSRAPGVPHAWRSTPCPRSPIHRWPHRWWRPAAGGPCAPRAPRRSACRW